jgi:hypothetical protein
LYPVIGLSRANWVEVGEPDGNATAVWSTPPPEMIEQPF